MALGLSMKISSIFPDNDDVQYDGITGITFAGDLSSVTITGASATSNFGNSKTISMESTELLELFHRTTEYPGVSVDSPSG